MSIVIREDNKTFAIQTKSTSYVFAVDNEGLVRNLYWGKKVDSIEDFEVPVLTEVSTNDPVYEITREEYPVYGNLRYKECCLKASYFDKSRETKYEYIGYTQEDNYLVIKLKDTYFDFEINLNYLVHEELDLIERWTDIKNNTDEVINIEELYSAQLHIPYNDLKFVNTHGHWGAEQQRFTQEVSYGKIVFENRRGISSHNHNPYFILHKDANETSGEVFFGALRLTGNFRGVVEQTPYGETLVQMGINPHDFKLELQPKEGFTTPSLIVGYSSNGFEKMSVSLHDFAKENLLREGLRPVLYNSWEATEFSVKCDEQIKLAKKAAEIGAELFVVDDGWFGQRDGIDNGLGDWYVNDKKFPEGLNPLINEVKSLGMKFGIWLEPEMVNPLSQLYKDHPDWIYHFDCRVSDTSRGQYVLNMTKKEVQDFVYDTFDKLLSEYDIDYIKWDANRPISQSDIRQDIWYYHIEAVYNIVKRLKEKYPDVLFEACASGGGRVDYGILGIFDDFWTSDNTDAYDRLDIQESYSYIYPIKAMRAWVTDCPNFLSARVIPMKFRFHSAMMGTLGIGCNILKLSEEDINISKECIKEYKEIREVVQEGDFYRISNISTNDYHTYQYVKDDKSLVFVFLPQTKIGHSGTTIKLRNLDENSRYDVVVQGKTMQKSGSYLMNRGIEIKLKGDYDSEIIKITRI